MCSVVTRMVRPTWRVERTVTSLRNELDTGAPYGHEHRQMRTFLSEQAAYLCAARWRIFARRDELKDGVTGVCNACCEEEKRLSEQLVFRDHVDREALAVALAFCRYHDQERFGVLAKRLARWLRWRDRKAVVDGGS